MTPQIFLWTETPVRHQLPLPDHRANSSLAVDHPLLELCLTSGKGLGLFAKEDIKRGTCLLSESPLLVVRFGAGYSEVQAVAEAVAKLSTTDFNTYLGLDSNKDLSDSKLHADIHSYVVGSVKIPRNAKLAAKLAVKFLTEKVAESYNVYVAML